MSFSPVTTQRSLTSPILPLGFKAANGPTWPPRNTSLVTDKALPSVAIGSTENVQPDTDDLFVRHGVAEVKERQRQLKYVCNHPNTRTMADLGPQGGSRCETGRVAAYGWVGLQS